MTMQCGGLHVTTAPPPLGRGWLRFVPVSQCRVPGSIKSYSCAKFRPVSAVLRWSMRCKEDERCSISTPLVGDGAEVTPPGQVSHVG
ncbi:hypothetical protein E2C01_072214 [Portunus trituberculatus]|uniref:Uncharacterized protein n=1 Tax=Portunus trituberculatus TaxID=210409 RepID=A0A5B7I765_PORTR|nr:hypothetical protein [Portunus trituberculatus]